MTRIAFTGASHPISGWEEDDLGRILKKAPPNSTFISGAARGMDTILALTAYELFPKNNHILVVPGAPHNGATVNFARVAKNFEIIEMPHTFSNSKSYMARNDKLVELADELWAFPNEAEEKLRSGTWSTVRRARKADLEVKIFPLNEIAHDKPYTL
jgi:hypothetical protein